jgi:hypothetical protein
MIVGTVGRPCLEASSPRCDFHRRLFDRGIGFDATDREFPFLEPTAETFSIQIPLRLGGANPLVTVVRDPPPQASNTISATCPPIIQSATSHER